MAIKQIRNHIPIGSPARREAADGNESPFRVSLGFEPAWFHQRVGVDFSERWHRDPVYRFETRKCMKAELLRRFPETDYWNSVIEADLASFSGCFGIGIVPAIFGVPLRFYPDRWPELEPGRQFSLEQIDSLDVDALLSSPFVEELFAQMDEIERGWGVLRGYLNWQGVVNTAFHLRGQQVFVDLVENPEAADGLLDAVTGVMIRLGQRIQERQRRSGFDVDLMCISNCVVNMISPRMYRQRIAPYDRRIAESFDRFGVHTCNWDVTPYLAELQALPKVGYLDMGIVSDMARVREMFPETRRALLYSPRRIIEASAAEIRADLERVARELAPCDIVMGDIPVETPDERVREFLAMCRDVERRISGSA